MTADQHLPTATPPVFATRFVGRQREVATLRLLVSRSPRLVTLVGVGGSGKTRLAAELASVETGDVADPRFGDGVVWTDLSTATEPGDVALSVAEACGVPVSATRSPARALVRTLADRRLLLVLDGCEHVSTACHLLVDELLLGCPGLTVVATSRVPLRSPHEHVVSVPPMSLGATAGERSEAAELFCDRAARGMPDNAGLFDDPATVNAICARVDGLPLAIELAAPWIRTLSARDLLRELERSTDLLGSSDPGTSDRHRSMRAVLDGTWRTMSETCRAALRGSSVFVGGFSAEAAVAVAGTTATALAALADLSLIRRLPDSDAAPRYVMHELVRTHALEMLRQHGADEVDRVRARHLDYLLDWFEGAAADVDTPGELRWLREVPRQLPDAGAALRWAHEHAEAERALRLTAALANFWGAASAAGRHRAEFDATLALPWDPASATQASARAHVLNASGWAAASHHNWEPAQRFFEEATALYRQLGNQVLYARGLCDVGLAVSRGPHPAFAPGYARQGLATCQRIDDALGIAWSTYDLGEILFADGKDAEAESLVLDGLRQLAELGTSYGVYCCHVTLGHAYRRQERQAEAIEAYRGAVGVERRFGYRTHGADVLAGLGSVALALDRPDIAARLVGAGRTWGEIHGNMSVLNPGRDLDRSQAAAERRLHEADWARDYASGRRLSTEQAMMMAESSAQALLTRCRTPLRLGLTEREVQVVRLVSYGLSDVAIAGQLVVSQRTVQAHLRSIFAKFGVKSRTAAVRRAGQCGLVSTPIRGRDSSDARPNLPPGPP